MSNNPRFLSHNIPELGQSIFLDVEESAHCHRVLRIQAGERVCLIDGKGTVAEAVLEESHPKRTKVIIESRTFFQQKSDIQLAFGLTKPQSLEIIFKKCTELGINSFQPLITDHSLHPQSWNSERWNKLLMEACKQCQDPWLPVLKEPAKLQLWIKQHNSNRRLFFCDENSRQSSPPPVFSEGADILIGPEGGWSQSERMLLQTVNSTPLGLGSNRLRSETACLVSLTLVKLLRGELS